MVDCTPTRAARQYFNPIFKVLLQDIIKFKVETAKSDPEGTRDTVRWMSNYYPESFKLTLARATEGMVQRNWSIEDVEHYLKPLLDFATR